MLEIPEALTQARQIAAIIAGWRIVRAGPAPVAAE